MSLANCTISAITAYPKILFIAHTVVTSIHSTIVVERLTNGQTYAIASNIILHYYNTKSTISEISLYTQSICVLHGNYRIIREKSRESSINTPASIEFTGV